MTEPTETPHNPPPSRKCVRQVSEDALHNLCQLLSSAALDPRVTFSVEAEPFQEPLLHMSASLGVPSAQPVPLSSIQASVKKGLQTKTPYVSAYQINKQKPHPIFQRCASWETPEAVVASLSRRVATSLGLYDFLCDYGVLSICDKTADDSE